MPQEKDTLRQDVVLDNNDKADQDKFPKKKDEFGPNGKTITNGENERACELTLTPPWLVFKYVANTPAFSHVNVRNDTKEKHAFKFKTNSNKHYMIRPSVGYLQPGENIFVKVTYFNAKEPVNFMISENLHVALFHKQIDAIPVVTMRKEVKEVKESKRGDEMKPGVQEFKDAYKNSPYPEGVHHFYCTHHMENVGDGGGEEQ